uniref:Zinc finger DHHC-type palmitoyltransferase 20 n=1 Tax=Naja naja TaxID=35670 RepID=A0A8C6VLG2_NAJNA
FPPGSAAGKMAPSHVLKCCQRVLAWVPVVFIALVVAWSYYAYVVELCVFTITSIGEKVIYLVIFHLSFVMFAWSYWKTIFTFPASPSNEFCLSKTDKEQYEKEERPESQQEILRRAAKELPVYTTTTSRGKPLAFQSSRYLFIYKIYQVPLSESFLCYSGTYIE